MMTTVQCNLDNDDDDDDDDKEKRFAEPQANGVADPARLGLQSFQSYRSRLFQLD